MKEPLSIPHPFGKRIAFLGDVTLQVTVEFGRCGATVRRLLALRAGSVIEIDRDTAEPVEVRANGRLVARGEVVVVNDHYGLRITEITSPEGSSEEH